MTDDDPTPQPDGDTGSGPQPAAEPAASDPSPASYDTGDRPPPADPRATIPHARLPAPVMATKEHRRFLEFADAVRRKRYVGLCFGAPGVGKTESARAYTRWDQLAPHLSGTRATGTDPTDAPVNEVLAARAVLYTPKVHSTPLHLDKEISYLCDRLGWTVELMLSTGRGQADPTDHAGDRAGHAELLIVDFTDRR
ncbi:hypothetical protein ACFXKW_20885 [Streptomyces sp. NPDC059193]|uniref:hypothetical protein n=1 Tax=Streptomyces sp. NPDC059193 TaxID=3346763 RepID=UPI00368DE594